MAKVLSVNVTSLSEHWQTLKDLPWQLLVVQECRIGPESFVLGQIQREQCAATLGRVGRDGTALTAIIARLGTISPIPAMAAERRCAVVWAPGPGSKVRVYCVYGEASDSPAATADTSRLCRECFMDSEQAGCTPALVAADLNCEVAAMDCQYAMAVGGWKDLGHLPTSSSVVALAPRRIDVMIANRACAQLAGSASIDWTLGVPAHAAQWCAFPARGRHMAPVWVPPPALLEPEKGADRAAAWAAVDEGLVDRAWRTAASGSIDQLWDAILALETVYLHHLTGETQDMSQRKGRIEPRAVAPQGWGRR